MQLIFKMHVIPATRFLPSSLIFCAHHHLFICSSLVMVFLLSSKKDKSSLKSKRLEMNFLTGGSGDGDDKNSSKDAPSAENDGATSTASTAINYFPVETYRKLGTDASRAISLVTKLKEAGAEYDLELPRLVFAGKQSAGKFSIVKALTSVQLPRHCGTCTRCPIKVTTKNTPGQPWTYRMSLRIAVDDESDVMGSALRP